MCCDGLGALVNSTLCVRKFFGSFTVCKTGKNKINKINFINLFGLLGENYFLRLYNL